MKKIISLVLCVVLALGVVALAGCSEDKGSDANTAAVKLVKFDLTEEEYAFGVDSKQPELLAEVNKFIDKIMKDGTFEDICDHYFGDGTPVAVTSAALDSSKDQLVVATNAAFAPFEYTQGESYMGIDMEIAALLAEELGLELVIENMDFDAVCLSVGQHKCDIAMAGLTVNAEREEYVTFSESYYEASQRLVVPSNDTVFADCADADAVTAALAELGEDVKIGVQSGTTGQFFVEGDADWGFEGLAAKCVTYKNGSLAIQDMLNGNINYVIIDAAPAASITTSINEML